MIWEIWQLVALLYQFSVNLSKEPVMVNMGCGHDFNG